MLNITKGQGVLSFTTKSGKTAQLRYPDWGDVPELTRWINKLSAENTFIRFSGEQQTEAEEAKYMASILSSIEQGHGVHLFCFMDGKLVAKCDVERKVHLRKKFHHVAGFSIAVDQDYRNEGIGGVLGQQTIEQAKQHIDGLRLVVLECFANNAPAMRLYEKLGFKEAGRLPGMIYHNGEYIDEVQMCLPVTHSA